MELQEKGQSMRADFEGVPGAHCSLTGGFNEVKQELDEIDGVLCANGNYCLEIVSGHARFRFLCFL